jgi:hypothetical protein
MNPPPAGFEPHCDPLRGQRSCRLGAQHRGFHVRSFAILLRCFCPSRSSSDFSCVFESFNRLLQPRSVPAQAAAPAAAEEECLPRPGKSTAAGQRWVYRFDGHRKCWFQTAQGIATVKNRFAMAPRNLLSPFRGERGRTAQAGRGCACGAAALRTGGSVSADTAHTRVQGG